VRGVSRYPGIEGVSRAARLARGECGARAARGRARQAKFEGGVVEEARIAVIARYTVGTDGTIANALGAS